MNIDDIASRIPSLSAGLIKILASMSEGMSNSQIAKELRYKNEHIVSTYIFLINKRLCLTKIASRIEKRQIAIEAFKRLRASTVTVHIAPSKVIIGRILDNSEVVSVDQVKLLLTTGYELDSIEMVFRKSQHQDSTPKTIDASR